MRLRLDQPAAAHTVGLPAGGAVVLGRQTEPEMTAGRRPFAVTAAADGRPGRVVVAWAAEFQDVSQEHARVEAVAADRVRVTNLSGRLPVRVNHRHLGPGQCAEETVPVAVDLAGRTVRVEPDDGPGDDPDALDRTMCSLPPANVPLTEAPGFWQPPKVAGDDPGQRDLLRQLESVLTLLQGAIGSSDYRDRAVEALVGHVGLRSGHLLLVAGNHWADRPAAAYPAGDPDDAWRPGRAVLDKVRQTRQVHWPAPGGGGGPAAEAVVPGARLPVAGAVVVAPLVDADNEVVGAVYGELPPDAGGGPDPLRLTLLKVIACGVTAGLVRQKTEREAVRLDEFFGPKLAAEFRRRDLRKGRTAAVTVLFCDIRGYSTLSAGLAPEQVQEWLSHVMTVLSRCVLDEDGVVVDYIGDGLMAMWGAPQEQNDQADRAVRAGVAMLRALPGLDTRWGKTLGAPLGVGIGVHRGDAQVGNCGTETRFKYGPLGDTVNRASRVQGLTKYLKCPLLVTDAVRRTLTGPYATRRAVYTRLAGIDDPVSLHEIAPIGDERRDFFRRSDEALDALEEALALVEGGGRFDGGGFSKAAHLAGGLLGENAGDGPLVLTLSRATDALIRDGRGCSKVWTPPGK